MDRLNQILEKCKLDNIPIVRDKTLSLMNNIITKNNYHSLLEIGTAYGYSAYSLSLNKHIEKIITVEKNIKSFEIAKSYLGDFKNIEVINANAFDIQIQEKFDFIFIDGSKSHQELLVNKFLNNLNPNGTMFIDNLYLKKFNELDNLTRNQKALVHKLKEFRN
jgi:predicted O-methyltransferase YrrM